MESATFSGLKPIKWRTCLKSAFWLIWGTFSVSQNIIQWIRWINTVNCFYFISIWVCISSQMGSLRYRILLTYIRSPLKTVLINPRILKFPLVPHPASLKWNRIPTSPTSWILSKSAFQQSFNTDVERFISFGAITETTMVPVAAMPSSMQLLKAASVTEGRRVNPGYSHQVLSVKESHLVEFWRAATYQRRQDGSMLWVH